MQENSTGALQISSDAPINAIVQVLGEVRFATNAKRYIPEGSLGIRFDKCSAERWIQHDRSATTTLGTKSTFGGI